MPKSLPEESVPDVPEFNAPEPQSTAGAVAEAFERFLPGCAHFIYADAADPRDADDPREADSGRDDRDLGA